MKSFRSHGSVQGQTKGSGQQSLFEYVARSGQPPNVITSTCTAVGTNPLYISAAKCKELNGDVPG